MIKQEQKEKVLKFYLDTIKKKPEKIIEKTAKKFNISEKTIYNILNDFDIPKPTEAKNDNDNYSDEFSAEYPLYDAEIDKYVKNLNHTKNKRKIKRISLDDDSSTEIDNNSTKIKVKDDLADDIDKMVKYTGGLVQYAKNLRDFENILQEINTNRRKEKQISDIIGANFLDVLNPKTETETETEKPPKPQPQPPISKNILMMLLGLPNVRNDQNKQKQIIMAYLISQQLDKINPEEFNRVFSNLKKTKTFNAEDFELRESKSKKKKKDEKK